MLSEVEERIKKLVGIPAEETIASLIVDKIGNKEYYRIITYSPSLKKAKRYRVRKIAESEVLLLWQRREKLLKERKEIEGEVLNLINKYKNPELIREALEKVMADSLKVEAKTYAYQKFKKEAMELYERFKQYLFKLKKEGMRRISILQALYLLANIYELFKDRGEEELEKALNRAVMTILLRDRNLKLENPFGVLRNDLFLPKETPYNFLLSPFLSMELEEILEKLLEAEKEKLIVEEAMAKISEFLVNLSDKAKERILKVFNSFEEFSKALYGNWKESKEDLKEFLNDWKNYIEMEVRTEEEEREILRFLKSLKMKEG